MQLTGYNYLGAKTSALGGKTFRGVDPSKNLELDPPFHEATEQEVDAALTLAESAFVEYRRRPPRDRAAFLNAIAEELESLGDALVQKAAEETALPAGR